ncbi:MAG: hypothetical protein ACTJHT_08905 [Sphingobacterium sp.]
MSHNYIVHLNKLIIYNRQYDQKEFFSIASLAMVASCSKDTGLVEVVGGDLSIAFDNVVGNENFALDKTFDIDGKIYTFNSFRYWGGAISDYKKRMANGSKSQTLTISSKKLKTFLFRMELIPPLPESEGR